MAGCVMCGVALVQSGRGRPREVCGDSCDRARAVKRARAFRQERWGDPAYREMHSAAGRRWAERNPTEKQAAARRANIRKFGITPEQYDQMLAAQGGGCAICGSTFADMSGRSLHIDHDHNCCPGERSCGECVRGLLCRRCNLGIAHFSDNPEALRSAADYLNRKAI